jgi:hypothetical protein
MIPIQEYIQKNRDERRTHLDLSSPCSEIGGSGSVEYKGLLAYHLGTTIPAKGAGFKIYLCHACNNGKCSNVDHLYWGTPSDNHIDKVECGRYTPITQAIREKYGDLAVTEFAKLAGGVKKKLPNYLEQFRWAFEKHDRTKRGWSGRIAQELGFTPTHVSRIAKHLYAA